MDNILSENNKDIIIYKLHGSLNKNLKSKSKNKTHKLFNNINKPRNLTTLHITKKDSEETLNLIEKIQKVKPDLKLPAVQIAYVSNKFEKNILSNSKKGTYIKLKNKNNYFKNIGTPRNRGYFLRKGAGAILINYVINKMKEEGIKSILIHPSIEI